MESLQRSQSRRRRAGRKQRAKRSSSSTPGQGKPEQSKGWKHRRQREAQAAGGMEPGHQEHSCSLSSKALQPAAASMQSLESYSTGKGMLEMACEALKSSRLLLLPRRELQRAPMATGRCLRGAPQAAFPRARQRR